MVRGLAEKIQHQLHSLPEPLLLEVLNFIGYLEYRHGHMMETNDDQSSTNTVSEQAVTAFRGSGRDGGTKRLLAERRTDMGREV
ncbi:MAG: hypothetical protein HQL07_08570 [Nitrospirae bacterium]|nr:hypothetical protein [Magnetococcales bacterium]